MSAATSAHSAHASFLNMVPGWLPGLLLTIVISLCSAYAYVRVATARTEDRFAAIKEQREDDRRERENYVTKESLQLHLEPIKRDVNQVATTITELKQMHEDQQKFFQGLIMAREHAAQKAGER